ncbi:MAG: FtsX-like permease family protein [Chloroflexi bacterium]|nr:FtsX-like permease family protein [Chloroflexota bacterium]
MGQFANVVRMVAQRSLGHWRLLIMMVAGVVLSSALMASVFLYSDAIRELGLKYALRQETQSDLNLRAVSSSGKVTPKEYADRKGTTDALLASVSDLTRETVHFGKSATFFLAAPGVEVSSAPDRPRANFQFIDGFNDHVRIVEGKAPQPATAATATAGPQFEVSIGSVAAKKFGVSVGQTFELYPHWREDRAPVRVVVAAIVEPRDADEEYWGGRADRLSAETANWPTYLFYIDESSFTGVLASYLPDMDASFDTLATIDTGRITGSNAKQVEDRLRGIDGAIKTQIPYSALETKLPDTISNFRQKLFFTRLPLFALMLQIVGIVLFYLAMVASMVVDRQTGEIALLKSRGASTFQVLLVFAIEAAGISGFAAITGPFLAAGVISLLGYTPPFNDLSGGSTLDVQFSLGALGLSVLGAVLAFVALVWPAYRACRFSITNYKQQISRPQQQPAFLRYYLDLVLIAAGAFAFYQLRERGSLVTDKLFGNLSADPLLLATPSLFILMVALVFLRLFPIALRLAVWLSRSLNGPTIGLALTRMVRSPLQHSRLILLLILTTAVGVFAAGFRATLEQGYQDRASYQAGAAARIDDVRKPLGQPTGKFVDAVKAATGASEVTPVIRLPGFFNASTFRSENLTMLGVKPDEFAQYAYWRGDFGSSSLKATLDKVKLPPAESKGPLPVVPVGATYLGLWAQPTNATLPLGIRLQDPDGLFWEYPLAPEGKAVAGQWQFYVANLTAPRGGNRSPQGSTPQSGMAVPRTVNAIYVRMPGNAPQVPEPNTLLLDDVQVTDATTLAPGWGVAGFSAGTVIEPFDDLARYELITGASEVASPGAFSRGDASGGRAGAVARLTFTRGTKGATLVGLRAASDQRPLPVLVDQKFLSTWKKKTGDEFKVYLNNQYVLVKIAGSFDLFPGYDPAQPGSLFISDFEALRNADARVPTQADASTPNSAWLRTPGTAPLTKEGLLDRGLQVEGIYDRQVIFAQQQSDPLVAASWEGILFLSFGAVLLLSGLGFVTYSTLSAQARSLEFAILRTMGFSGRQIIGVVSFEQTFVIIAGVAAGTLLGFPLSRLMIGYMGITEKGVDPLPPLISRVSWNAVATVYVLLGLVVVATVSALVLLYSRLAVSRALRMGEL